MPLKELTLKSTEALKVARALSSETSIKILELLSKEKLDVSTIARRLKLSEAYMSQEINQLAGLRLIRVGYAPGKRGIRKICELAVKKVTIIIRE